MRTRNAAVASDGDFQLAGLFVHLFGEPEHKAVRHFFDDLIGQIDRLTGNALCRHAANIGSALELLIKII